MGPAPAREASGFCSQPLRWVLIPWTFGARWQEGWISSWHAFWTNCYERLPSKQIARSSHRYLRNPLKKMPCFFFPRGYFPGRHRSELFHRWPSSFLEGWPTTQRANSTWVPSGHNLPPNQISREVHPDIDISETVDWWIHSFVLHTVDGRDPAPVEVGGLSHYLQGFIHPRSQVV